MKKKIPNAVLFGAVDSYKTRRGFVSHAGKKIRGWYYFCDRTDRETLSQYANVRLFRSQAEYAPEIRRDVVFVGDKCF